MTNILITIAFTVIFSYLCGSVMFAVIVSKVIYKKDVREMGSGNAGTSNTIRNFGKAAGIIAFFGDMLKGTLAVVSSCFFGRYMHIPQQEIVFIAFLSFIAVLMGHTLPIFFGFRGGKGVATGLGCIIAIAPPVAPVVLLVFFIVFFTTRIFSIGSIIGVATFPFFYTVYLWIYDTPTVPKTALSVIVTGLIIFMHRENIKRLLAGTEPKYTKKKS